MDCGLIIKQVNDFVWGPIMLALLVGTGIFLTIRLKFKPWTNLPYAIKMILYKKDSSEGDVTPFQSLMIALSATVGTGNIVGVATAMVLGGPGALVWMWISAAFGLSTKYAESVLAVKYRETNNRGEMAGGPMYAMKNGIGGVCGKAMAALFAFFSVCASFGIGNMTQANSIAAAFNSSFNVDPAFVGAILVILTMLVLLKGVHSIGAVSSIVVPVMATFYIIVAVVVIVANGANLPAGIEEIFAMAFSPGAMAGGVGGTVVASMMEAMRWGVARGVFSNEAGLGSAPIAAAAARTDHPSRQGYVNMTGTFFDTMIICVLTGLVIASSGALGTIDPATGKVVSGAHLTILAFSTVFGEHARVIISCSLALFAFSTILGWEYYGEKALEYLWDNHDLIVMYRTVYAFVTYIGATQALDMVWDFSDTANGLMAIPNLICLLWLSRDVAAECFDYEERVTVREKRGERVNLNLESSDYAKKSLI